MSQCLTCGAPTKTRRQKQYRYTECGLPNVVIDDVELRQLIESV